MNTPLEYSQRGTERPTNKTIHVSIRGRMLNGSVAGSMWLPCVVRGDVIVSCTWMFVNGNDLKTSPLEFEYFMRSWLPMRTTPKDQQRRKLQLFHSRLLLGIHVYVPLQPASPKHRAYSAAKTTDMWAPIAIGLRSTPDHSGTPRQGYLKVTVYVQ